MAKKSKLKTVWDKIRFKYKLSVLNEKTLEEAWAFRLSLLSALYAGFALFIFTVLIVSALIVSTPIKNYLPGYLDINARQDIVKNSLKLDSLETLVSIQEQYLKNVKSVIKGDIKVDSISKIDSLTPIDIEKLKATDNELEYRKEYEEEEAYKLSIQPSAIKEGQSLVFSRPASGVILSSFSANKKQYGLVLQTSPNSVITAVLEGSVILTGTNPNGSEFIQVLHPEGFISLYKNCARLLKSPGQTVKSGEAIASTSSIKAGHKNIPFIFELWRKGKPVNPTQFIAF